MKRIQVLLAALAVLSIVPAAEAHDPKNRKLGKTAAQADLDAARKKTDAAKERLRSEGRYTCCISPSCDMCARVNGSCACAANVAAGKGACGECYAGWQTGKGALKGIKKEDVKILPSDQQACHVPGDAPPELAEAREHLDDAKRTLISESRYSCCVRQGGCDSCAHEGVCACGGEVAEGSEEGGVCGDCLDGWHRGHGAFPGVAVAEIRLDPSHGAHDVMTTVAGGTYRRMNAIGSGTSILPATSPSYMWHFTPGDWMVMLHGELRAGFNKQNGPRGVGKAESQNWLMVMADRKTGPGLLSLRGMFSAEPLTAPHGGFPELFQTGETYRGREIVDAQHSHDLFMELAAAYTLPLGERASWQLYAGVVGEPALGPTAFMHRPSAMENPAAPLGHHWQDATHITHGVITTGFQFAKLKLEGSVFHGAEPDENRGDIEMGALDSWSARVSYTPTRDWSMQLSHGRLNEPEALESGDTVRTTASIHHNRTWEDGNWASAIVWGRNSESHGDSNAYLFESTLRFRNRNTVYTRMELVDKPHLTEENIFGRPGLDLLDRAVGALAKHDPDPPPPGEPVDPLADFEPWHRVGAFTFGYVRDLFVNDKVNVGLGADFTFYATPRALDPVYGSSPTSAHVFVRIRPGEMR